MTNAFATPVINSEQLAPLLGDPRLVILDASMAGAAKATEFLPGARYFDIDRDFSDLANPFPHGLQSAEEFQAAARRLGLNDDSIDPHAGRRRVGLGLDLGRPDGRDGGEHR